MKPSGALCALAPVLPIIRLREIESTIVTQCVVWL